MHSTLIVCMRACVWCTHNHRNQVFEFIWNISLRSSQVEMVNGFLATIMANDSVVRQLMMGSGKTTVVSPLLGLMLSDGKRMVVQAVPQALVQFTR